MKNPSKFHYLNHRLGIRICQQSNLRKDTLLDKISVQNNRHAFVVFFCNRFVGFTKISNNKNLVLLRLL